MLPLVGGKKLNPTHSAAAATEQAELQVFFYKKDSLEVRPLQEILSVCLRHLGQSAASTATGKGPRVQTGTTPALGPQFGSKIQQQRVSGLQQVEISGS